MVTFEVGDLAIARNLVIFTKYNGQVGKITNVGASRVRWRPLNLDPNDKEDARIINWDGIGIRKEHEAKLEKL